MNNFQRLWRFIVRAWEPAAGYATGLAFAGFLLLFQLHSLVPGLSKGEINALQQSRDWHTILNAPVNAPHKVLGLTLAKLDMLNPFALRGVSVFIALLAVAAFYYVLARWHTSRIALLGTTLLVTSSWFLHYARIATPDILLPTALLLALVYGTWIRQTNKSDVAVITGFVLAATLLYLPGFIWFVLLGAFWQRKAVTKHLRQSRITSVYIAIVLGAVLVVPLSYAVYHNPEQLNALAGFPTRLPTLTTYAMNLLEIPVQLFLRGAANNELALGRLPLLDIFTTAMSFLGIYAYFYRRKLDRTKMLIGTTVMGSLLIALEGPVTIILLLPILYILAAAGMTLMLQQWFTVFPRNPLANVIGTSLISIAVILTAFYHVNHYYIAWPNAPETKRVFQLRP